MHFVPFRPPFHCESLNGWLQCQNVFLNMISASTTHVCIHRRTWVAATIAGIRYRSRFNSVSRGVTGQMQRTYREETHGQRSAEARTNQVGVRLGRGAYWTNHLPKAVTEKTWTPILVVKGVYYKSFLQSVAVYLAAGQRSPSASCLPFMNDQKIRIFPVDRRTVRFRRPFPDWAMMFGLSVAFGWLGESRLPRANVSGVAG